ncbi:hypothetical protein HPB50_027888 [Hyalomma asiaticum]|nr:hypothetical protein HPB50_027888 [Hyalomma asiaticum]
MNLDELTILGEKIGLSGDALRAWLEEEKAKEREARREEAEREARARETELALACEVAALEEKISLLRIRFLEAQNAARAHASVHVDNVSFPDHGSSGRHSEFFEEASMPTEKSSDVHKELKNEAKENPKPERSIASVWTRRNFRSCATTARFTSPVEKSSSSSVQGGHRKSGGWVTGSPLRRMGRYS